MVFLRHESNCINIPDVKGLSRSFRRAAIAAARDRTFFREERIVHAMDGRFFRSFRLIDPGSCIPGGLSLPALYVDQDDDPTVGAPA